MPLVGQRRSPVRATRRFSDFAHFKPRLTQKDREVDAAKDEERQRLRELTAALQTVEKVDASELAMLAQLQRMGLALG